MRAYTSKPIGFDFNQKAANVQESEHPMEDLSGPPTFSAPSSPPGISIALEDSDKAQEIAACFDLNPGAFLSCLLQDEKMVAQANLVLAT